MVITRNERQRIQALERRRREKSTRLVFAEKWVGRSRELWFAGRRERLILMHLLVELEEIVGWHPSGAEPAEATTPDGCVKLCSASLQNDGGHVFAEWFCDADDLLRENPHADACMVGRKAERDQLACAAFHVVRGSAIVQNNKRVRALKKMAPEFQQELDLLLRAVNDKNVRIVIHKPVVSFVVGKVGHINTI